MFAKLHSTCHRLGTLGSLLQTATILLLLLIWVTVSSAQSVGGPTSSPTGTSAVTIRKDVQEVNLILTVRDHHGHFVRDLTSSDFAILDNDAPPDRITYFENQTDLPLRIALLVDLSESMSFCFRSEQKAAAEFLKHVIRPDSDLAFVIGFNQDEQAVTPPTNDVHLLSKAIKQLKVNGETAIYSAVAAASQQLANIDDQEPTRRIIIVITDGDDNRSHVTLETAAQIAQTNAAVVYVLSTNQPLNSATDAGDEAMRQLSSATGGTFLRALDSEFNVSDAFSKIAKELRSQYAIGYKPANTTPDGTFHRLVVLSPKKIQISHRQGYFAR
jgi:Ca-activated chloride channel family protein